MRFLLDQSTDARLLGYLRGTEEPSSGQRGALLARIRTPVFRG